MNQLIRSIIVFVLFLAMCSALQAETVVLRFTAPWCEYCQRMNPDWAAAKRDPVIAGAKILDIDVDQNKQAVNDWKVGTIPACVIVESQPGQPAVEVGRLTGFKDRGTLTRFLKSHLEAR